MSIEAPAGSTRYNCSKLCTPRPGEESVSPLLIPKKTNYVATENCSAFPPYRPCRDHRLFSALFVAAQERVFMVAAPGNDQPVTVRMAAYAAPGCQWPYLRGLWRCLRGHGAGLAQSRGWRAIVRVGLGWRRRCFIRDGDHCVGLERGSVAHDISGFMRELSVLEVIHHV
jgi:hypothetical protein